MKPQRVQLSRRKGWRMPKNTVKVDRTTKWGNPFIIGKHGNTIYCVRQFRFLCRGFICVSVDKQCHAAQMRFREALKSVEELRGKNLACWCRKDSQCHADVLLEIANLTKGKK